MNLANIFHRMAAVTIMGLFFVGSAQATTVRGTPVTVMNTAPDGGAIPVTGNVGVTGTVDVRVTNTVPVSGSVSVTGAVSHSDNPELSPFQIQVGGSDGTNHQIQFNFPTETGKQYIIEYVNAWCWNIMSTDKISPITLMYGSGNGIYQLFIPFVRQNDAGGIDTGGYGYVLATGNLHIAADRSISLLAVHTDTKSTLNCGALISGHTIPLP